MSTEEMAGGFKRQQEWQREQWDRALAGDAKTRLNHYRHGSKKKPVSRKKNLALNIILIILFTALAINWAIMIIK